ncbi:MAG: hypothetical protein M3O62_08295 [Pseudomonadota bacterium]|nr:hypothetical protein [Pseudomonadota bacterium]
METSAVQAVKLAVVASLGLSKDAAHIYVGLSVFLITAWVLRKPWRSVVPWFAVLAVACAGELLDAVDNIRSTGHWIWRASLHDILNTLFWPTVLLLLARCRRRPATDPV